MQPPEPRSFRHVGTALGLLRELRRLTQTECTKRVGVTKAQLSLYERDRVPQRSTFWTRLSERWKSV
jgi:transcriptional regulator with XRE-family HTH domain